MGFLNFFYYFYGYYKIYKSSSLCCHRKTWPEFAELSLFEPQISTGTGILGCQLLLTKEVSLNANKNGAASCDSQVTSRWALSLSWYLSLCPHATHSFITAFSVKECSDIHQPQLLLLHPLSPSF